MAYIRREHINHPQQVGARPVGPRLFVHENFSDTTDDVDDRATPQKFWESLDSEFNFTVDAAAASHNAKCERYWTKDDSGLEHDWHGEVVWCNPPYSQIEPWVRKAHESDATVVMLLPANRTEQKWWQRWVEPHRDNGERLSTRFVEGRLRFYGPDGSRLGAVSPPFGCVLLIWRGGEAGANT